MARIVSAARKIKAGDVQIRQGASLEQLSEVLGELLECLEMESDICQVRQR